MGLLHNSVGAASCSEDLTIYSHLVFNVALLHFKTQTLNPKPSTLTLSLIFALLHGKTQDKMSRERIWPIVCALTRRCACSTLTCSTLPLHGTAHVLLLPALLCPYTALHLLCSALLCSTQPYVTLPLHGTTLKVKS